MAVIGREAISQVVQVLQEERETLLRYQPVSEMTGVWVAAGKQAIPEGYRLSGVHTADTLAAVPVELGVNRVEIELTGSKIARFLYTGTVEHRIPIDGIAIPKLHFFWAKLGYQEMFRGSVNHPKVAGKPWREAAREFAKPAIIELAGLGVQAWLLNIRRRLPA